MSIAQFVPGLVAAAVACGMVLSSLCLWNESGLLISVWLGLIATVGVGVAVLLVAFVLRWVPGGLSPLVLARNSLRTSLALSITLAITLFFIANGISRPDRLFDVSFFVPMGLLYGAAAGTAFWHFSGVGGGIA